MIETLKQLIRLQAVDCAIQEVEKRRNQGPERIRILEDHLRELDRTVEDYRIRAEECLQKRKTAEEEIEEVRAKIGKSQAKLSLVKNNREYRAILKEVDDLKRSMKAREEEILQFMEEYEKLENFRKEQEKVWEEQKAETEREKEEIEADYRRTGEELGSYERTKQELVKDIDQATLDKYDFIRKNRAGIAVAGVRKGICSACHMNLPPQRFNELMRNDRILTCPSCQRLIYWMDHEVFKEEEGDSETGD